MYAGSFWGVQQTRSSSQSWLIFSPSPTHLFELRNLSSVTSIVCPQTSGPCCPRAVAICSGTLCWKLWACTQFDESTGGLQALPARKGHHRRWVLTRGPDHGIRCTSDMQVREDDRLVLWGSGTKQRMSWGGGRLQFDIRKSFKQAGRSRVEGSKLPVPWKEQAELEWPWFRSTWRQPLDWM